MGFAKRINFPLSILPVLIFSLGYVTHLSTSVQRANTHLLYFIVGCIIFWALSFLDYVYFAPFIKKFLVVAYVALFFTHFLGERLLGSARWISIGQLNFQPSELAKVALVLYLAFYVDRRDFSPKTIFKHAACVLPLVILVLLQPDLGSAIVLLATFFGVLFVSGLDLTYFIIFFSAFGVLSTPIWALLKDYQKNRILVFLNPSFDPLGRGYNVIQSLIAIGSGGLFGKGFGHGTQAHLNFLPIYWTDFVFAAFAEEWGFVGVCLLVFLFAFLLFILLQIASKCKTSIESLLVYGVFFVICTQFLINVGMNLGLAPVTGIPLPLVSLGGTSLVVTLALLGMVHSVWINKKDL